MLSYFKPAIIMLFLLTLITGVAYPVFVTFLAQSLFSEQANGSLIKNSQGQFSGSELIGQSFSEPKYFWSRPSATAPYGYNAAASSGSNLGPTNPVLIDTLAARVKALKDVDLDNTLPIPVDLVTASGSGLDPHISIAAAEYQLNRVARLRNINPDKLHDLVEQYTEARQWLVLGEPRVNVLKLNLALDQSANR